jgi:hypothetical protein
MHFFKPHRAGATSDSAPGIKPEYNYKYYAAFIRGLDGNRTGGDVSQR